MPKGQTSRPYNRKEKKAVATLKNLKAATKGFSQNNKNTVMSGKTATAAQQTLTGRGAKQYFRNEGKKLGRIGLERVNSRKDVTTFGVKKKK